MMKSGKVIDVSKSSLISLKAELVRKHEEVERARGTESFIRPVPKKKKEPKVNPGIEERKMKDELTEEEVDLQKKSKEVLEVKAKLYDKLERGDSIQEKVGDSYLVDFKEKLEKVFSESSHSLKNDDDEIDGRKSDSDDEDWVDYVDCLGRTRRCLKEDVNAIKERDDEVRKMLGTAPDNETSYQISEEPDARQLEMISNDMQREKMREKWEQEEQMLLNKKNIYYEDIRFDEARTHGVAYYGFSTDESKREEQQAEFMKLRLETAAKQKETQAAKERRDAMKQARLIAARQRQRERLGLPPISTDVEEVSSPKVDLVEETKAVEEDSSVQDLEAALTRAAHVRPWDLGKDGVKQPSKIMTQEEWVEMKRDERPEEFAPIPEPENYNIKPKNTKYRKYNYKKSVENNEDDTVIGPLPEPKWNIKPEITKQEEQSTSTSGVSIPPPATFDYYTPNKKPRYLPTNSGNSSGKEMRASIEAGLEFLKKESERREKILQKKYPNS